MKRIKCFLLLLFLVISLKNHIAGQTREATDPIIQGKIDSIMLLLSQARHDWGIYSNQLIEIGKPAVPALLNILTDQDALQWNRRKASMTLSSVYDDNLVAPCMRILLNEEEDMRIRNQVTGILKNYELSKYKYELESLFKKASINLQYNVGVLLLKADDHMAYSAFETIFETHDFYGKKQAIRYLTELKPEKAIYWYLEAIQSNDWMTANFGMDQLIDASHLNVDILIDIYQQEREDEEIRWRITYIMRMRNTIDTIAFLINALQDESWLVYNEAAVGLKGLLNEDLTATLISIINETKNEQTRAAARWIISP